MSDEHVSIAEEGASTAKNVTKPVSVLALMDHAAAQAMQVGPRPAAYEPRLRTDSLTRPPMQYMSATVTKLDGFEEHGAAVAPAVTALDAMHAVLTSVITARDKSTKDPELMHSEASQVLRVADYTDKISVAATRSADAANAHLQSQIKATQAELNKTVTANVSAPLASEIRAHCKAQKSPTQFVSELIAAGDEQGVSAILGAPPYLAGLTQQMREALTLQWNTKRQPQLTAKLALLEAVAAKVERAGSQFVLDLERAQGVNYRVIKNLRDAKSAAHFG